MIEFIFNPNLNLEGIRSANKKRYCFSKTKGGEVYVSGCGIIHKEVLPDDKGNLAYSPNSPRFIRGMALVCSRCKRPMAVTGEK